MRLIKQESGSLNPLTIPLIMASVLLLGAIGFGAWAFLGRSDYKNNVDEKIDTAVKTAVIKAKSDKDKEFLEKEKLPLREYNGPEQYGSISLMYPKTWSIYVSQQSEGLVLQGQPDIVNNNSTNAIKIEVLNSAYNKVVAGLESQVKQGKITADAYSLPNVPDVVGLKTDGQIAQNKNGSIVYLPLRDKTIKVTCENQDRLGDFNNIILKNLKFTP